MLKTKCEKRKSHIMLPKKDQVKLTKMTIKLFLLLGTAEIIGLLQIPNVIQNGRSEVILNVIFGLPHNALRSSRGILMFPLFAGNIVLMRLKKRFRISNQVSIMRPTEQE